MEKVKLIIAGGRNFQDYELVLKHAKALVESIGHKNIEIVSGGAKGVDLLGERFASENNLKATIFKADWKSYGRAAGPKRNAVMAEYGTHLLSFWDGTSKGTRSMIELAKRKNLKVTIVDIA